MQKGKLYLIPVPLAVGAEKASYTFFHQEVVKDIKEYIVENEKTARHFLKATGLGIVQSELVIHGYGKYEREKSGAKEYFKGLLAGKDVGLMSEAGCPGVADPGADIVAEAHRLGIQVVPLVGPSSILLALMASGFNGQQFTFHGYLPIDKAQRAKRMKNLEVISAKHQATQIFIETPFRNNQLMRDILRSCKPSTRLCVACNLTAEDEFVQTKTIADWKKVEIDLHRKPSIFLLYNA